jgi:hypothetical protein
MEPVPGLRGRLRGHLVLLPVASTAGDATETFLFDRGHEAFGVGVAVRRPIWRLDDADPSLLQACESVAVADQYATDMAVRDCDGPRDLAHERIIGMRGRPEDLDPSRGQLDDKDRVERNQAPPRPVLRKNLNRSGTADSCQRQHSAHIPRWVGDCRTHRLGGRRSPATARHLRSASLPVPRVGGLHHHCRLESVAA